MNYQELIVELKRIFGRSSEGVKRFSDNITREADTSLVGKIETVDTISESDYSFYIKYFPLHNIYIRITADYSSYDGEQYRKWDESVDEVLPEKRIVTAWIRKENQIN